LCRYLAKFRLKWQPSPPTSAQICKRLMCSGIDSASLCSLSGRHDMPICCTGRQARKAGGIDFLESIPGLLKRFQIRAQQSKHSSTVRGRQEMSSFYFLDEFWKDFGGPASSLSSEWPPGRSESLWLLPAAAAAFSSNLAPANCTG
jgi:hypothetical protein